MAQLEFSNMMNSSTTKSLRVLARKVEPIRADEFLCSLANLPELPAERSELPPAYLRAWERISRRYSDLFPKHGNPEIMRPNRPNWERPIDDLESKGNGLDADAPGLAWEDPDEPGSVRLDDISPKLRLAWRLPSALGRQLFLVYELAYYLRGPRMFEAEFRAHQLLKQAYDRALREGVTPGEANHAAVLVRREFLNKELNYQRSWTVSETDIDAFALVLLRAIHVADLMHYCLNPTCHTPYFIARRRSQQYCTQVCAEPAQRESKRKWWSENGRETRRKHKIAKKALRGSRKPKRTKGNKP